MDYSVGPWTFLMDDLSDLGLMAEHLLVDIRAVACTERAANL